MASSISKPIARDRAIMVIMFRDIPRNFITINDDITDMGRAMPVITVERQEFMKQNMMKIVRKPPRIRLVITSSRDSRVEMEPSRTIVKVVPGGNSGCNLSTIFFTESTVSTTLAPDCLRISNATAGTPLINPNDRCSSTPSLTSATSARRIGRPERSVITIFLN